jgi:hypothetical protein
MESKTKLHIVNEELKQQIRAENREEINRLREEHLINQLQVFERCIAGIQNDHQIRSTT